MCFHRGYKYLARTDVEKLKDIFRDHRDSSFLVMRDVVATTDLKQVTLVYKYTVRSLSSAQESTREERNRTTALLKTPELTFLTSARSLTFLSVLLLFRGFSSESETVRNLMYKYSRLAITRTLANSNVALILISVMSYIY